MTNLLAYFPKYHNLKFHYLKFKIKHNEKTVIIIISYTFS